jgi:hypothetical protein
MGIGVGDAGVIGFTYSEIRRLLINLAGRDSVRIPSASGPGRTGGADASTRPGSVVAGNADNPLT